MKTLRLAKTVCIVSVFYAASTIASLAQTFNTLVSFDGTNGAYPFYESLIQGTDGNYYGLTSGGGAHNAGTVFSITPTGTLTTLYSFCSQADCTDGESPYAGLVQASNGNFYGTTLIGGANGQGTVFEITSAGTLTTLYSFCAQTKCTDGENPWAGLVLATNGNLYGTTAAGGANCLGDGGCGTVFEITTAGGELTTLYSFCPKYPCDDGDGPIAALVQAANGNFYGTTDLGGVDGAGTVFEITPAGKVTTLYSFTGGKDGGGPYGTLVQAANGNFYGTTFTRANGGGTVFKITPTGSLTTLYTFCSQTGCTDGASPQSGLVLATNGNFYGTTTGGGANGYGSIFEITPKGKLTTLHSFDWTDGEDPRAGLMQATDGIFYGTTTESKYGYGTVFSLSVGLGPFVETQPTSGKAGASVTILGTNLTGSTSVTFNGTAATFTVVSDSEITTNVPSGATTGKVEVTTPSGTLDSNVIFRVTPQITSFTPTSGAVGTIVTVTGVSLTQTTKVTFAGVAAAFTVDSDTQVTATVPTGAETGKIAITTAGGSATSTTKFTVTP